jgi:polar amino acid transport system substrate-binding protein
MHTVHVRSFRSIFGRFSALAALAVLAAACASTGAPEPSALKELAPTGVLRVGIVVAPSVSPFLTTRESPVAQPRGVTVDLANALGREAGLPVSFVVYPSTGALFESVGAKAWDVSFLPMTPDGMKSLDYGAVYFTTDNTLLAPSGSAIRSLADADRPGVRIGVQNKSTSHLYLEKTVKSASVIPVPDLPALDQLLRSGKADVVAHTRPLLNGLSSKLPGTRVADGSFVTSRGAVAVPKGHSAALKYVSQFVERAKASGAVQKSIDQHGIKGYGVPPAGQ